MSGMQQDQRNDVNARLRDIQDGTPRVARSYQVESAAETARRYGYSEQQQAAPNTGYPQQEVTQQAQLPAPVTRVGSRLGRAMEESVASAGETVIYGAGQMLAGYALNQIGEGLYGGGHGCHRGSSRGCHSSRYSRNYGSSGFSIHSTPAGTRIDTGFRGNYGNGDNYTSLANRRSTFIGRDGHVETYGNTRMSNTHYGDHGATRTSLGQTTRNGAVTDRHFSMNSRWR